MGIPSLGGILVNREGLRFVAEDIGPSALAPAVLAQSGGAALEIFDQAIEDQLGNHSAYQQARQAGCVLGAQTLPELAAVAGVDPVALQRTLGEVAACAQGQADPLGRRSFARVLSAPFKASWVTGALSHTQGGLLTDAVGRVLHENGQPIDRVFAVGGCAAGLSGRGADGYLPGNGLAQAFGLGWRVSQALG
jgi:fumarate reductase flavoprotein subunit